MCQGSCPHGTYFLVKKMVGKQDFDSATGDVPRKLCRESEIKLET
jgi:hypothetical protein